MWYRGTVCQVVSLQDICWLSCYLCSWHIDSVVISHIHSPWQQAALQAMRQAALCTNTLMVSPVAGAVETHWLAALHYQACWLLKSFTLIFFNR